MDGRGRLVLPAALRNRLGIKPGDELVVTEEQGVLRLEARLAAARSLIGIAGSSSRSMVEELRADRRRESHGEDLDASRPAPK